MKHFSRTYWLLMLLILPVAVNATPFHIVDQSAYQGGAVTLSLFDDSTTNLEAATLRINYDPALLSFSNVTFGTITSTFDAIFSDDTVSGIVDVSLATFSGPLNLASGSLLSITFNIFNHAAPGDTNVSIECLNNDWDSTTTILPCQEPTSADSFNDYFVPNTVGKITILAQTAAVPEPGIIMLMLFGLLGLSVSLQRKQAAFSDIRNRSLL